MEYGYRCYWGIFTESLGILSFVISVSDGWRGASILGLSPFESAVFDCNTWFSIIEGRSMKDSSFFESHYPPFKEPERWSDTFKHFLLQCLDVDTATRPTAEELLTVSCVSFVLSWILSPFQHPFLRMACPLKNLNPLILKAREVAAQEALEESDEEDDGEFWRVCCQITIALTMRFIFVDEQYALLTRAPFDRIGWPVTQLICGSYKCMPY